MTRRTGRRSPFPTNDKVGYRSEKFKARQRERREWDKRGKSRYAKAELSNTGNRSYEVSESVNDYGNAELKLTVFAPPVTTGSRSLLRSSMASGASKGIEKKVLSSDSRYKGTAAAIQHDDNPDISFWAEDESLVHSFGGDA